jgi:hypothetical protein
VNEAVFVAAQPVHPAANRTAPTANPKMLDGFGTVAGNALDTAAINYGTHARLPQFVGTFRGSAERLCW